MAMTGSMDRTSDPRAGGLVAVLIATAVAGGSGYLIQLVAPRLLTDPHEYLSFSVFWSTLYLIGSAVGGIQQEIARAARPADVGNQRVTLVAFTGGAVLIVVIVSAAAGFAIAPDAFAGSPTGMAGALGVGLTGYVVTSVVTGLLYGLGRLRTVAVLIIVDAVLRAVAVVVCLAMRASPDIVALAIALPFGLAVGLVWLGVRNRIVGAYVLDVPTRRLALNAGHTVVAAAATGLMVTGMPLLFRLTLTDTTVAAVAALTLLVTLTRAPFIIPLMALQSYLTVTYRDDPQRAVARMWRYLALAAATAAVAGAGAWFIAPPVIGLLSSGQYTASPAMSVVVVVSAVLVGSLCLSGPALLAQARHRAYSAGWVVAAIATIALLTLVPAATDARVAWALLAAPALGLAVHLGAVGRGGSGPKQTASAPEGEQPG